MAGKRQIEPKVTKNKEHGVKKRKLDLEKEKVKLWCGVLEEVGAVQTELMHHMNTNSNQQDLHLICHQLRAVNSQGELLDAMIQNYVVDMLSLLVADQGKGNS
ncbi:hypothetical protein DITRI_Ditri03aG0004000 [Diplodiscus trichospermus]